MFCTTRRTMEAHARGIVTRTQRVPIFNGRFGDTRILCLREIFLSFTLCAIVELRVWHECGVEGTLSRGGILALIRHCAQIRLQQGLIRISGIGRNRNRAFRNLGSRVTCGHFHAPTTQVGVHRGADFHEVTRRGLACTGVIIEVEFVDEGFTGEIGVDPVIGREEGFRLLIRFGGGHFTQFSVQVTREVPGEFRVSRRRNLRIEPLIAIFTLVNGPRIITHKAVFREREDVIDVRQRRNIAVVAERTRGVTCQFNRISNAKIRQFLNGQGGRIVQLIGNLGKGCGTIKPCRERPSGHVVGIPRVDGVFGRCRNGAAHHIRVRIAARQLLHRGGVILRRVRIHGQEDANRVILQELCTIQTHHRTENRSILNRLRQGRTCIKFVCRIRTRQVGEGHGGHANRRQHGVGHGQLVNQDATIRRRCTKAIRLHPVTFHEGLNRQTTNGRAREGVAHVRCARRTIGVRHSVVVLILRKVNIVGRVDRIGDFHIGDGLEASLCVGRVGGGADVEAHGLRLGFGQTRSEGDAASTVIQNRRFNHGGSVRTFGFFIRHHIVELHTAGQRALLSKGFFCGRSAFGCQTILPIKRINRRCGHTHVGGGPRSRGTAFVGGHANIVKVDVGVIRGIHIARDDHHETQGTLRTHQFCAIQFRRDGDHRPFATRITQFNRSRGVFPFRFTRDVGSQEARIRAIIGILQHDAHGGQFALLAIFIVLRNAVAEADGTIALVRIGQVKCHRVTRVLHTFGGDFTITIGVILTRTLHQEALTARVVHWQRVQLVIIFGANPNTHAHETRVRIKAFIRKERHSVIAIAVLIITAPGRNGNVINKDIAIVIIGFNGQFSIGGTHRQFAQLIHFVRIEIVGLRNISATSRYLHAASLASNRRQARDLHTSRTRGVCSNLPNRTCIITRC